MSKVEHVRSLYWQATFRRQWPFTKARVTDGITDIVLRLTVSAQPNSTAGKGPRSVASCYAGLHHLAAASTSWPSEVAGPCAALKHRRARPKWQRQRRKRPTSRKRQPRFSKLTTGLLEVLGHEPVVTYGGASAIGRAAKCMPDLVFLDIGMPSLDGYETCRRIRGLLGSAAMTIVALNRSGATTLPRRVARKPASASMC